VSNPSLSRPARWYARTWVPFFGVVWVHQCGADFREVVKPAVSDYPQNVGAFVGGETANDALHPGASGVLG
jgi:hypothetical protein